MSTYQDRAREVLEELVTSFAEKDEQGEWWGHDTDLGNQEEAFDQALSELASIVESHVIGKDESFKNGFDEGVALHDQDVKAERERISHELKEIAWDDSKVRPGLKQVNLEFALEIVNKSLKSNER